MQQNVAALAEDVKGLQSGLNADEKARLMQAVSDVAKGQQELQSRLDTLIKTGQNDQIGQSLNTIESGQEALRQQTAKLGDQIESIKARGPGPFKAVKGARLELLVAIGKARYAGVPDLPLQISGLSAGGQCGRALVRRRQFSDTRVWLVGLERHGRDHSTQVHRR